MSGGSTKSAAAASDTALLHAPTRAADARTTAIELVMSATRDHIPPVIILESADHVCYSLPRSLAFRMSSVQSRIASGEGAMDDEETGGVSSKAMKLFFPDINSTAMKKVVEFVTYEWREGDVSVLSLRPPGAFQPENQALQLAKELEAEAAFAEAAAAEQADPAILDALATIDGPHVELIPRPPESMYAFLRAASSTVLCELASASFYLDVKPLVEATCRSIAGLIRGKSAEEIRETFSITNDFTPAEEEAVNHSIIERAMLLPAHIIEGEHGAQALLSAPIPKPAPLITPPVRESKRSQLRSRLQSKLAPPPLQPAQPPTHTPSVDELMDFIEERGDKKKHKTKKGGGTKSSPPPPAIPPTAATAAAASPATPTVASVGPAVPAAVAMISDSPTADDSPSFAVPSASASSASVAKKKKKKAKKKSAKESSTTATTTDAMETTTDTADVDTAPASPTHETSFATAAASAFRDYSSSALSALMNDPEALAGLLAHHLDHDSANGGQSTSDARRDSSAGASHAHPSASFSSSLGALVHSLHSLESFDPSLIRGGRRSSAEIEEYTSDDESIGSTRSMSSTSNETDAHQAEIERFQSMLASAAASSSSASTGSSSSARQRLPPNVLSNIATFTGPRSAAALRSVERIRLESPVEDDAAPFFLPDAQLSKLIDAKLSGLANWEAKQHGRERGQSASPVEFTRNSMESLAPYMCACSPTISARANAQLDAAAVNLTAETVLTSPPPTETSRSASCPSSPSMPPVLPAAPTDAGLSHMTLCAHCGLFQVKNASMDDSQLNLASPSKRSAAAGTSSEKPVIVSPSRREAKHTTRGDSIHPSSEAAASGAVAASAAAHAALSAPSAVAAAPASSTTPPTTAASPSASIAKARTSPTPALPPPSSSAAATPTTPAPAPAPTCQNHGSGSCSCCASLAALLPKLSDLQHRVASLDNSQKQSTKSMSDRLRVVDKFDAQLKALQGSLVKMVAEERAARQRAEETMRKEAEAKQKAHEAALEEMRATMAANVAAAAQAAATTVNETKQRMQRLSDRLGAVEKAAAAAREESERESKRVVQKVEKAVAQAVTKELTARHTAAREEDRQQYVAMCQRMEQAIADMEVTRAQYQQQQAQAIESAVTAALDRLARETPTPPPATVHSLHDIGSASLSSHYTSSGLLPRAAPSSLPLSSGGSSLHSVFSGVGVGPSLQSTVSLDSAWPPSSRSPDADLYPSFDSSNAVASSLLGDDAAGAASHSHPSFFTMFPPPRTDAAHAASTNAGKQHGAVGTPFASRGRAVTSVFAGQSRLIGLQSDQ